MRVIRRQRKRLAACVPLRRPRNDRRVEQIRLRDPRGRRRDFDPRVLEQRTALDEAIEPVLRRQLVDARARETRPRGAPRSRVRRGGRTRRPRGSAGRARMPVPRPTCRSARSRRAARPRRSALRGPRGSASRRRSTPGRRRSGALRRRPPGRPIPAARSGRRRRPPRRPRATLRRTSHNGTRRRLVAFQHDDGQRTARQVDTGNANGRGRSVSVTTFPSGSR